MKSGTRLENSRRPPRNSVFKSELGEKVDLNTSATIAPNGPMRSRNEGARIAVSKSELLLSPQIVRDEDYTKVKTNLIAKLNRTNH